VFRIASVWEYGLYAGLGLVAAVVGVAFIRILYGFEDIADRVWGGPEWLRPAVGGLALGLLLLAVPQMYGVGYPVLERAIREEYVIGLLLLFMVGKIVATSLTIAIGGSGGVFAPSLFMGAMLGTAYGDAIHRLWPGFAGPAGAYGLVGMGAVFAAAARAPMTAIIIIFELTGQYEIILPLMFAIALAAGIGNLLSRDTIYSLKLWRRGIDIMRRRTLLDVLTVGEAMRSVPAVVDQTRPVREVLPRFSEHETPAVPILDATGRYRGALLARHVERSLGSDTTDVPVGDLARQLPTLKATESLRHVLPALIQNDDAGLPVVDVEGRTVIGWLTHRDVLGLFYARVGKDGRMAGSARATGLGKESGVSP
jgi:CIC family chloride channel protein